MIKNIVFDIGNVLADFRIMEFLTEKGLDVPTIKRVIKATSHLHVLKNVSGQKHGAIRLS
ncbi:MAG: hypothetical protein IJ239_01770 [Eubacterium sp.]|nr:hypothetical protein [Eubacterium sp.]